LAVALIPLELTTVCPSENSFVTWKCSFIIKPSAICGAATLGMSTVFSVGLSHATKERAKSRM